MSFTVVIFVLFLNRAYSLNNGVAKSPPMGWSTWNLYHRDFTAQVFDDAVNVFTSTSMKNVGYEYINVDGGWWWSVNGTVSRNNSGYAYFDPIKYPNGIQSVIEMIHSNGLKYGHYTDAGTAACDGDTQMSEYYMPQDVSLFIEWGMDMIKVDSCNIKGNDTEIIFQWRDMLNATGKPVLFSDCRNQCQPSSKTWNTWCIDLANMWRVSSDIKAEWNAMLSNHDWCDGLGKFAQPGAWNDPDFLEIDIGEFKYDGTEKQLLMNEAHFSLWSITSNPLILGNNLTNMTQDILNIITNKDAIDINQNYLNNAGDVITEFNITQEFKNQYEQQVMKNKNMTTLYYKPLPQSIGDAAFVFLNRDNVTSYQVSLDFNELPLSNNQNDPLNCDTLNVWTQMNEYMTLLNITIKPQSVIYMKLSNCKS